VGSYCVRSASRKAPAEADNCYYTPTNYSSSPGKRDVMTPRDVTRLNPTNRDSERTRAGSVRCDRHGDIKRSTSAWVYWMLRDKV